MKDFYQHPDQLMITERIRYYKTLSALTKPLVVQQAKFRGLKPKSTSTSTKGVIIEMILDNDYPY